LAQLLDIFGYLAVILRALTLAFSALVIGGISFRRLVARESDFDGRLDFSSGYRIVVLSSLGLTVAQALNLFATSAILQDTTGMSLRDVMGASFFLWGAAGIAAAIAVAIAAARRRLGGFIPVMSSFVLLASTVATSHAAARLDDRPLLLIATAAHQAATACWIGGLPFLLRSLAATDNFNYAYAVSLRFSRLAMASVGVLLSGGMLLAVFYVGSGTAIYGTNYGVMLVGKALLFGAAVLLGLFNYRIVRQLRQGNSSLLIRLRRFGEAEIGIGITAILAAASLTSQPPAVDLIHDQVSWPAIVAHMSPQWPRLTTPPLSTLSPSTRELWKKQHPSGAPAGQAFVPGETYSVPTEGDIAWSEYNHHWAGVVVLVMGVLAVLSRFRGMRWARHWPLAFVGLAIFLFLRADPENWPLGPSGFWESFSSADVTQHRLFVVLILLFAAFEWGVETGRLKSSRAALVFPLICAGGGAMLLTHTHALTNVSEQLFAELSHLPLALLAVIAGWARWLELRLPGPGRQMAGRLWPVCFALIGAVLLLYREA
jgi:putative copper resistance protein D